MTGTACMCNAKTAKVCCVAECDDHRPGRGGCFPCNTWRNNEQCLQTGQRRDERRGVK